MTRILCLTLVLFTGATVAAQTATKPAPKTKHTPTKAAGVTPTDPMPCTLEWPRIGNSPACGFPTIPRMRARLAIACTLATP